MPIFRVRQRSACRRRLCRHRAKEPKVKASSKPSKTLEESQKIKCLLDNPKTRGMKPYNRYEKYKFATTVKEFYEKGGTPAYLKYDIGRGFIEVIQGKAPTSLVSDSDTCDEGDCHSARNVSPTRRILRVNLDLMEDRANHLTGTIQVNLEKRQVIGGTPETPGPPVSLKVSLFALQGLRGQGPSMAPRHAQNVVTGCTPRFTGKANVLKRTVTGRQKLRNCRTMKNLQTDKFLHRLLEPKGSSLLMLRTKSKLYLKKENGYQV